MDDKTNNILGDNQGGAPVPPAEANVPATPAEAVPTAQVEPAAPVVAQAIPATPVAPPTPTVPTMPITPATPVVDSGQVVATQPPMNGNPAENPIMQPNSAVQPNLAVQPNSIPATPVVPTSGGVPKKTIKLLIIVGSILVVLGGLLLTFFLTNGFGLLRSEELSCTKFQEMEEWSEENNYSFTPSDLTAGGETQAQAEESLSMIRSAIDAHPNQDFRGAMNDIIDAYIDNDYTKLFSVATNTDAMAAMEDFSEKCDSSPDFGL
ncbi:MAG: hypothetical protein LBQ02_02600 [Candidatus Nomurabacteria bacterium]|jgi:hypothetical protein|nr:hypothetical protein [Candidatus Nomurabacteria bacterium]